MILNQQDYPQKQIEQFGPHSQQQKILMPILKVVLKSFLDNHIQMDKKTYSIYFQVFILQTSPYLFITDGYHVMQAIQYDSKPPNGRIDVLSPDNKIRSNYYNVYPNAVMTFNCNNQDVQQRHQYPHPYQVFYHFQNKYEEFLKQRSEVEHRYKKAYAKIAIKKWKVKLVNIANTCYYAPIIEIHEQSSISSKPLKRHKILSSILYQKELRYYMQKFQLKDFKSLQKKILQTKKKQQQQEKRKIDISFYIRNSSNSNSSLNALNPHVDIDESMEICKYDPKKPLTFISFSDLKGLCYSMKKFDKFIINQKSNKRKDINFDAAQKILEYRHQTIEAKENKRHQEQKQEMQQLLDDLDLSSQQEQEDSKVQRQKRAKLYQDNNISQSSQDNENSDDDEDILRKLYINKIVKKQDFS